MMILTDFKSIYWYFIFFIWHLNDVQAQMIDVWIMKHTVNIHIVDNRVSVKVTKSHGDDYVADIGRNIELVGVPSWKSSLLKFKALWQNGVQLFIKSVTVKDDIKRLRIQWQRFYATNESLLEFINLNSSNWYGGSEGAWPIQNQSFIMKPYISGYNSSGLAEPYFLSSSGISYYVNVTQIPLFVELDANKHLYLKAEFSSPYRNDRLSPLILEYILSVTDPSNMTKLRMLDGGDLFGRPTARPSFRAVEKPIWSTKAFNSRSINQSEIMSFVNRIHQQSYPASHIEIYDGWESCNGDEVFDPLKFPNPKVMIAKIRELGYDVTLGVHPFVNCECKETYRDGERQKFFVTAGGTTATGRRTNQECSAVIDVTNEAARRWWAGRLRILRNLGVTSFVFDAGQTPFLPDAAFLQVEAEYNPGNYMNALAKFAKQFGSQSIIRGGHSSQTEGLFMRPRDCTSDWSSYSGLQSVIKSVLQDGMVGYPFALSDFIGGSATYNKQWPNAELFIRWTQLSAFLPVMQFSVPPWFYNYYVETIAQQMIELHADTTDIIKSAMDKATIIGSSIIQPLWWIDANDTTAQTIKDEFLVGSTYLVAPVLRAGAVTRNIYVPVGTWTDVLRGDSVIGPKWLYNYSVALHEIPYFIKQNLVFGDNII